MQFKQYPSYKKSGVEWLGDVPEHWQIVRTKDIFNHRKEEALEDDEIVTAFRDGQVTLRKNRRTDGFTNSIKEHGYQHINNGDLVIHEMDAFAGAIGVSDSSGKSTPVYTVCYAKNENINHHFYSHFFRTMAKTGFINSLAKGIRVRSTEFRWNESRNVYLVEPPKSDQQKIVAFLDTETTRIDNLISKQEKLIELLEEQRKSIISHAVTKGLNPNAPMKDSGVEWLGEVPKHWSYSSLKYVLKQKKGAIKSGPFGSHLKSSDMVYSDVKVINQRNVIDKDFIGGDNFISFEKYEELKSFTIYPKDVLVTTRGTIGKVAQVAEDLPISILHPCLIRIQVDENKVLFDYINYFFECEKLSLEQLRYASNAATIDVIYCENLAS
ncbi:restriction endonuclease subunit S, partial [Acinetobacter junii]